MTSAQLIRVLVYEDKPDLRASLCQLLSHSPGVDLVGAFGNCLNVAMNVQDLYPDVVLMDIDMPSMNGIEGLRHLKAAAPAVNVLMLTIFDDDERIFEAICAGAEGYMLKKTPAKKLLDAVAEVHAGGSPMTPAIARQVLRLFSRAAPARAPKPVFNDLTEGLTSREQTVLKLLVDGFSYKMIAAELAISIDTVRSRIKNIYEKLQVRSSTEAVSKALRQGLV